MHLTQEVELSSSTNLRQDVADEPLLRVRNLRISFITRAGRIQAINAVSFEVRAGEIFGLVGETGCGKSQTALAVMRLTPEAGVIERGEIWFAGDNLAKNISSEFKLINKKNGQVKLKRNKSLLKRLSAEVGEIRKTNNNGLSGTDDLTKPSLHCGQTNLRGVDSSQHRFANGQDTCPQQRH